MTDFNKIRQWAIDRNMTSSTPEAQIRGLKIEDCISHAYIEIKDRKGKLVNGVFVKEV